MCLIGISGDIKAALAGLPRFLTAERTILATLQRLGPTHWLPVPSRRSLASPLSSPLHRCQNGYGVCKMHRLADQGSGA
jgi:hypothetical protein